MGILELKFGDKTWKCPLGSVTTIGRHWSCIQPVTNPRVPLFWLEIRHNDQGWCWRPLETRGLTRGGGRQVSGGWRSLGADGSSSHRVHCGKVGQVRLIDAAPPALFAHNLRTGDFVEGDQVQEVLELHDGRVFELGQGDNLSSALVSGSCFSAAGEPYRLNLPVGPLPTTMGGLNLAAPNVHLDIDRMNLTASFTQGTKEVAVKGECVRVLIPYALMRRDDDWAEGGWLTTTEAHRSWIMTGGKADSGADRLAWDKGRLRTKLGEVGATNVAGLFDKRRLHGEWWARLNLTPAHICVDDQDTDIHDE